MATDIESVGQRGPSGQQEHDDAHGKLSELLDYSLIPKHRDMESSHEMIIHPLRTDPFSSPYIFEVNGEGSQYIMLREL